MTESSNTASHELSIQEMKEFARTQPKIALDDPRILLAAHEPVRPVPYRGNFFRRFPDIRAVSEDRADQEQVTYVRMVKERFGVDLVSFYAEHFELCDAISNAIDDKNPYDMLVAARAELEALELDGGTPAGSASELDVATEHPLGIEAIGMYYWDKINPLLEQAYAAIEPTTLNAPFLTK